MNSERTRPQIDVLGNNVSLRAKLSRDPRFALWELFASRIYANGQEPLSA